MLLLRELLGLAHVTRSKKQRSWSYSSVTSRPRKILATNVPPGRRTLRVMLRACARRGSGRRKGRGETARGTHCEKELRLDELVEVVQARDVWCAVAHDEVGAAALEVRDDLLGRARLGDVALDLDDAGQRGLQGEVLSQLSSAMGATGRARRTMG